MPFEKWVILAAWLSTGFCGAGFWFAYMQGRFPSLADSNFREDLGDALFWGLLFGPFGLVYDFFLSGFGEYGWWIWGRSSR